MREFDALLERQRFDIQVREYHAALICTQVWNSKRTNPKQKVWKPENFMSNRPKRAPKPKGDGLDVIRRLDTYNQMRFGEAPK